MRSPAAHKVQYDPVLGQDSREIRFQGGNCMFIYVDDQPGLGVEQAVVPLVFPAEELRREGLRIRR